MKKLWNKTKELFFEYKVLLRSVPALILTLFVLSVVGMNLLANKSIDNLPSWLALDMGIILSWLSFLTMDVLTKRFGPRASILVSVVALLINLLFAFIFFLAAVIPGTWSQSYVEGSESIINIALNDTFRGTWYILLGSSIAFIVSAIVNSLMNYLIGKGFKKHPDSFVAFALRSYVSTAIGQFVDNFLFAIIVSKFFFGWTWLQCVTCALTGMVLELLFEVVFSPLGYISLRKMEKENIGQEYIEYREGKKNENNR